MGAQKLANEGYTNHRENPYWPSPKGKGGIRETFGKEYDVTFNAKKTLGICYGNVDLSLVRPIYLNGVAIRWQRDVKYLGNILSHNLSDAADIKLKKGSFYNFLI